MQSVRAISDQNGEVISRRDFLPFGEELPADASLRKLDFKYAGTNDGVRQKFTGYEKDEETGLDFAQARMYQNQHARFTAIDPLLASGKSLNPQTFNRYVYVMNSPLQYIDPEGLQASCRISDTHCMATHDGRQDSGPGEFFTQPIGTNLPQSGGLTIVNGSVVDTNQRDPTLDDSMFSHSLRFVNLMRYGHYLTDYEAAIMAFEGRQLLETQDYGYIENGVFHPYNLTPLSSWQTLDLVVQFRTQVSNGSLLDGSDLERGAEILPEIAGTIANSLPNWMPSSKKLDINMTHIRDRHTSQGTTFQKRVRDGDKQLSKFPDHMTADQIENVVREAYKNAKIVSVKFKNNVRLQGTTKDGTVIEMYYLKDKKLLDTAYPIKKVN